MAADKRAAAAEPAPGGGGGGAYDADEHMLPVPDVAARYATHVDDVHPDNSKGLAAASIAGLQARWGRNAMTPPKQTPEILKLLIQFTNPLLLMLTLACVLTFLVYGVQKPREAENLILASTMAVVILFLAFTSYWQERSAGNVMGEGKKGIGDLAFVACLGPLFFCFFVWPCRLPCLVEGGGTDWRWRRSSFLRSLLGAVSQ